MYNKNHLKDAQTSTVSFLCIPLMTYCNTWSKAVNTWKTPSECLFLKKNLQTEPSGSSESSSMRNVAASQQKCVLHRRHVTGSNVHLELAVISCCILFLLQLFFQFFQFAQRMIGRNRHPGNLRQAAGWGPSDRRVPTLEQELSVVNDTCASWCGGEQGSSRSLAVTVWELGPVLQLDHTGRDGTAPGLLCVSWHCGFISLKVQ